MSDGNMTYEDWLRGCVHHDGRHGYVTLPCDEVLKIADFIERLRESNANQHVQSVESVESTQTETKRVGYCNECKWFRNKQVCGRCRSKNLFAKADTPQTDEFKNFDRESLILLIECQKERIGELLADKDTPQPDCDHKCIQTEAGCEQTDCPWK